MLTTTEKPTKAGPVSGLSVITLFGSVVRLAPTEGCYQKEKEAIFLGDTASEYRVRVIDESRVRRFRKSTMHHVSPHDRQFPDYRLVLLNTPSETRRGQRTD
jgi:hypothetical protein